MKIIKDLYSSRPRRFFLMINAIFLWIGSTYLWRSIAFLSKKSFELFKLTFPFFKFLENSCRYSVNRVIAPSFQFLERNFLIPFFTNLHNHVVNPVAQFSWNRILVPFFTLSPFRYLFKGGLFKDIRNIISLIYRNVLSTPLSFISNYTIQPFLDRRHLIRKTLAYIGSEFILEPSLYYIIEPLILYIIKPTCQITYNLSKLGYLNIIKPSAFYFHRITKNLPIFNRVYPFLEYVISGNTRFLQKQNIKVDIRPINKCSLVKSDAIDNNPHYYMEKGSKYYFVLNVTSPEKYSPYQTIVVEILRNGVSAGRFLVYLQYETKIYKGEDPYPFTGGFHFLGIF